MEKGALLDNITRGSIFIYPTDTIYGLGCNAQKSESVRKIRKLKGRTTNPFSVIAPSVEWINENCLVTKQAEEWIDKLPAPYTLILKLKNYKCVSKAINLELNTLGVRIPNHWIKDFVAEANLPIVTTSVNKSNEDYMTSLEDLDPSIQSGVDFVLFEGKKEGKPSKIIDLTGKVKIIER